MGMNNNLGAHKDCLDLFQRAKDSPNGVRALMPDYGKGHIFQMRMHHTRALMRWEAKRIYPQDNPLWGTSEYDGLVVRLRQDTADNWWIYVSGPDYYKPADVEELGE